MKQLIISIGREFGSGGREIAKKLSELYNIPLYDRNLLKEIASEKNLNHATLEEYDEKRKRFVIYRKVRGMDASPEVAVAHLQFNYLKDKAAAGESFVVVGRCAETMLKDNENMIPIFVLGDEDVKIERVMKLYNKTKEEAIELMNYKDRARKDYHNHFCPVKWGDSRNYELSINSSKIGIDESVKIIAEYINARIF
jgi:cytidylate kinase